MSKLAHLKKKAAELEQKRLFDKALAVYEEILQEQGSGEETDIALLNRVGDLYLRQGAMEPAIRLYEQAADLYAERGFLNNAIALCNKILRQDPRRAEIHLRLGRVSARNGFRADARRHFLEYATQRDRSGATAEALDTLRQVADEGAEFEDVRLLLADLLVGKGQTPDAVEQLRLAREHLELAGRPVEAQAVLNRILELDPDFQAQAMSAPAEGAAQEDALAGDGHHTSHGGGARRGSGSGLVLFEPTDFVAHPRAQDHLELVDQVADVMGSVDAANQADVAEALSADVDMDDDAEPRTAAERLAASLSERDGTVIVPDGLLRGAELELPEDDNMDEGGVVPLALEPLMEDAESVDESPMLTLDGFLPTMEGSSDSAIGEEPTDSMYPDEADSTWPVIGRIEAAVDADEELESVAADGDPATTSPEPGSLEAAMIDFGAFDSEPGYAEPASVESAWDELDASSDELELEVDTALASTVGEEAIGDLDPAPVVTPTESSTVPGSDDDGSYVNLGDWLREDAGPRSTRMVVEEQAPSGDENADFADMLHKFKQGVAENVADDDYASYYDLGIAYREMGLLDEAIASLQKALRGTRERVRAFEALGQCFLDREQPAVAASVLRRALSETGLDDERLVGVLYLLGRACEEQNQRTEALGYYQRVFAVDIEFGDVADRIGFAGQVSP